MKIFRVQEMQRKREYREILRGRIIPTGVSTAVATNVSLPINFCAQSVIYCVYISPL